MPSGLLLSFVLFFPCSRISSYLLLLFLCLISLLLFPCASVWENTRAWAPHFLVVLFRRCLGKFTEYADDMVLLAPTVTALQTLLEVCDAYAGPHDIVYNTTKTVCMLVRPKQSLGRFSTRVRLGNESFQNSIRKLTVSYSDTFKRLTNVPRFTSSSLAFAMNATDHINVVFRKFAYSLMRRVTAFSNSIVTAIVNSDAYHQSPLMDKWESMLYV